MHHEVERYRKRTRILHWIHSGSFVFLFFTGLILFIPALAGLAEDSHTRVIHRVAAVLFIVAPLLYAIMNPKKALQGIKEAFTWGAEDMNWLRAAPRYYFLADEGSMPPQEHMNTGQKMWWFMVIVFGVIFVITGLIRVIVLTFYDQIALSGLLQWSTFVHDVAFIATGTMFFVHVYLSVVHPLMRPLATGAWSSMARGKVSVEYAKSHHGKWYDRVSKGKEAKP